MSSAVPVNFSTACGLGALGLFYLASDQERFAAFQDWTDDNPNVAALSVRHQKMLARLGSTLDSGDLTESAAYLTRLVMKQQVVPLIVGRGPYRRRGR